MQHTDLTHGNTIANEVEIDLDVFGTLMLDGVRGHVDGADVVAEDDRRRRRWSMKLLEKLPKPTRLSHGVSHGAVLGFSARARDRVLSLGGPRDEIISEVDTEA